MPATNTDHTAIGTSSTEDPTVVVKAFPSTDGVFARDVAVAIEAVLTHAPDDDPVPVVEGLLHRSYPNVRIHHQTELARLVEWDDIWYAYRDGRIRTPSSERDRLYALLSAARRTADDSSEILERSRSIARHAKF